MTNEVKQRYEEKLQRVFNRVFGEHAVDLSDGLLSIACDNEEDYELATELAHQYCMIPRRFEIASDSIAVFESAFDIDGDPYDYDDEDEGDDEFELEGVLEHEGPGDEEDTEIHREEENEPSMGIDDGRTMRVLTDQDSYKFALKIYTSLLGNESMERFPAFMMDLDRFFKGYLNPNPPSEEVASAAIDFMIGLEMAKKKKADKSGRSAFLSSFMGALSSDIGSKVISAYERNDAEAFGQAMGGLVMQLLEGFPEDEGTTETPE